MNPVRKRAYTDLLIVAVIWGSAPPIIKYTLGEFEPSIFLTYRFFISAVIAVIFFILKGIKLPKDKKTLTYLLINSFLLSTVSLGLLFLGADKTTSVDNSLISAMSPIIVAIAGIIFLKEKVTKRESLGLLIALSGTFLTILEPIINGGGGFSGLEGNLLIFAHILVGAVTAVLAKKVLRKGVDPETSTHLSFIIGFITILPFSFSKIVNSNFQVITSVPYSYHLGVWYMAVLSGTLAYILWHRAEKSIEISEVGFFAYLYPIFGIPLSLLWLGEKITLPFLAGCILIIIGVALAQYKRRVAK